MAGKTINVTVGYLPEADFPDPVGQDGSDWAGVFRDEFNTGVLDTSKWQTHYPYDPAAGITRFREQSIGGEFSNNQPDGEKQAYLPSGISFGEHGIVFTATKTTPVSPYPGVVDFTGLTYTSGLISSYPGHILDGSTDVYIEASMRMPLTPGILCAFWFDSAGNGWPPEIDFEWAGGNSMKLTNWGNPALGTGSSGGSQLVSYAIDDVTTDHAYGLLWRPSTQVLEWYFDGEFVFRETKPNTVPTTPMYVVLDLAVEPAASFTSTSASARYVRIWEAA